MFRMLIGGSYISSVEIFVTFLLIFCTNGYTNRIGDAELALCSLAHLSHISHLRNTNRPLISNNFLGLKRTCSQTVISQSIGVKSYVNGI